MRSENTLKRTIKLKNVLLSSSYELCIERIKFFTEIYKQYPDDPEILKRAKAIAYTLKKMTIFIRDNELLVGNETSKNLGEKINLDLFSYDDIFSKRGSIKKLAKRKLQPFHIEDHEIEELQELLPFWQGKTLYADIIQQRLIDEKLITGIRKLENIAPNIAIQVGTSEGHLSAGYEKLLKLGYIGIINEAESFQRLLSKSDPEFQEKFDFYEAVKIYYKAAIEFSLRYSDLAREKALNEKNNNRKKELETISITMEKISKKPPDSLYEAIQYIWFTQNIANIIFQRSVIALGRLDQILWPYYNEDLNKNRITRNFALELIEELNLKLTWNVTLLPTDYTMIANALGQNTQTITISGVNKEGKDVTNEISYLF